MASNTSNHIEEDNSSKMNLSSSIENQNQNQNVTQPEYFEQDTSLFDCPLCQQLLMEPITTSCGHSFCKTCILRAMDHSNKCPLCRTVIHISPEYGIAVILQQTIQTMFPAQYQQRLEEYSKENKTEIFNLGFFILGDLVLYPHMPLPLHVFEPRYRLMTRRAVEGCKRFGIVRSVGGQLSKIGTTAIIDSQYIFPDGRSLIANTGGERFKILETWDLDGYKMGKVEYIHDHPIPEDRKDIVSKKYQKAMDLATTKFSKVIPEVEEKFGKMPTNDVSKFSWWLSSVVPADSQTKYYFLETQNVESRIDELTQIMSSVETKSNCIIS